MHFKEPNHANTSNFRSLTRGNSYTLRDIVDAYMAQYPGRDVNVSTRLVPFVEAVGDQIAHEIDAEQIQDVLESSYPSLGFHCFT